MTIPLKQYGFIKRFTCLGDACEDTCCKGWGMQVDAATVEKYRAEAPELLEAVTSGEAEHIMQRDPATDYCVKFEGGWCGIHKAHGSAFLGDACHFFPRITRALGDTPVMSAALSCPEVVRQIVHNEDAFTVYDETIDRVPHSMKNYLPDGIAPEDALQVHQAYLSAARDNSVSPERAFMRIASVARSMQALPVASWKDAAAFYFKNADSRLVFAPEPKPEDPFNLLHALCGLIAAAKKTQRPRLMQTIETMETALHASLDWERVGIMLQPDSAGASERLQAHYKEDAHTVIRPFLRSWLAAQIAMALFPYSGFGATLHDRITTLGVRFAVTKLALLCHHARTKSVIESDAVRILQSLSRFLDHLADPELLLAICKETGWEREARLRALVGDE
jgi:lysine-N-methylase